MAQLVRITQSVIARLEDFDSIDAGRGFQNYPEEYGIIEELHGEGEMTLLILSIMSCLAEA